MTVRQKKSAWKWLALSSAVVIGALILKATLNLTGMCTEGWNVAKWRYISVEEMIPRIAKIRGGGCCEPAKDVPGDHYVHAGFWDKLAGNQRFLVREVRDLSDAIQPYNILSISNCGYVWDPL